MIGLVSFGLYLWHFPIITFINQGIGPTSSLAPAVLAITLTFGATALSFVLVETPIRRRGTFLRFRLAPRRLFGSVPVASGLVAAIILMSTASGTAGPAWGTTGFVTTDSSPGPGAAGSETSPVKTVGMVGD